DPDAGTSATDTADTTADTATDTTADTATDTTADTATDTTADTATGTETGSGTTGTSTVVAFRRSAPVGGPPAPVPGTGRRDVEVRVGGRDGAPVDGVAVAVLDGAGREIGAGTTDARGVVTVQVPGAGQYVVVSSARDYQPGVATCAVADDPARVSLTVSRSAAVHGVVRTASGSAMAGVAVTLEQDGETVGRADTGTDGGFRIADLGAGHYLLAAGTGAGAASQPLHVTAEADVEQDLRIAR
ncbi:carboxypeptidase regulatory-like domain-containing protein, partial [Pseudonocardia sp. KRD291]|uniref:carboxypeptidase regulatory-like domain-containing protein n=1 Tax=Pseudonocardia sp. KRD291 TaxID=2792007 RepID=UPI001C49D9CA